MKAEIVIPIVIVCLYVLFWLGHLINETFAITIFSIFFKILFLFAIAGLLYVIYLCIHRFAQRFPYLTLVAGGILTIPITMCFAKWVTKHTK